MTWSRRGSLADVRGAPATCWNLVRIISDSCNSAWVDISIFINPILQTTTQRLREVTIPQVMILRAGGVVITTLCSLLAFHRRGH